jgi:hypothetical protein
MTKIRVGKFKLYNDRSTTNNRTAHNRRPNAHMLEKTVKEAYLIDVTIPYSRNLCSTITKKLQKHSNLK